MADQKGFEILIRGDGISPSLMLLLRDDKGIRASRECRNLLEVNNALLGWIGEFNLSDIEELFDRAFEETDPAILRQLQELSKGAEQTQFLTPEEAMHLLKLSRGPYRPNEILACEREIEANILLAEKVRQPSGYVDPALMEATVSLRLQRDRLYAQWATGGIR